MTAIQWTDETWNPVTGCTRVSEGCRNCYIERTPPFRMAGRKLGDPVQLHPDRLAQPLRWTKPRRVFVNSLSDLFHEDVPTDFLKLVLRVIAAAPQHTFQVLTKRPERMRRFMSGTKNCDFLGDSWGRSVRRDYALAPEVLSAPVTTLRLANLWLGVSVEDQNTADERIPILLQTRAAVRFVSCEPALGPVDLSKWVKPVEFASCWEKGYQPTEDDYKAVTEIAKAALKKAGAWDRLDWVIAGGESGPGARPCDVAWIRSIVEQCRAASVPCFVKQLGSQPRGWCVGIAYGDEPESSYEKDYCDLYEASEIPKPCPGKCMQLVDRKGGSTCEWPESLRVREWPR